MRKRTLHESLNAMMERGAQLAMMAAGQGKPEDLAGPLADPDLLTTLELWYHLYKEDGGHLVGDPKSLFAAYHPDKGKLQIFAANQDDVEIVPYRSLSMLAALSCAQEEKASFSVIESQVSCQIGDVQARGASYGEAALRAMVKHQRQGKSSK